MVSAKGDPEITNASESDKTLVATRVASYHNRMSLKSSIRSQEHSLFVDKKCQIAFLHNTYIQLQYKDAQCYKK